MIDKLVSEIGALPILASSYDSTDSAGPHLANVVLAAASESTAALPSTIDLGQRDEIERQLIKRETAEKLAGHYFANIYPRLPFFSVQGFWTQFTLAYGGDQFSQLQDSPPQAGFQDQQQGPVISPAFSQSTFGADDVLQHANIGYVYFTVLIVCAISTSSLSRSTDSVVSHNAEEIFQAALRFREYAILPNTIVGLQAVLFLTQYATLNPSRLNCWYLIGVGMRICVDLGLHQDLDPSVDISESLLETRRRLFWSMYSFDRSMSLGSGRPCEISDDVIRVEMPQFRIEFHASEVEVLIYRQRYRILQLQSIAYDRLYSSAAEAANPAQIVGELRGALDKWSQDNPSSLPEHSRVLMESEWHQSMMLIYRPCRAIRRRTPGELFELWNAALGFAKIYRRLVESNEIFYIQIASEKAYTTGLALIYSYWQLHRCQHLDTDAPEQRMEIGDRDNQADKGASFRDQDAHQEKYRKPRSLDLWNAIGDVNFVLRALSDRWEEGRLLAQRFEKVGSSALELLTATGVNLQQPTNVSDPRNYTLGDDMREPEVMEQPDRHTDRREMPGEIVGFWEHSSLTSVLTAQEKEKQQGVPGTHDGSHGEYLKELVLEVVRGRGS